MDSAAWYIQAYKHVRVHEHIHLISVGFAKAQTIITTIDDAWPISILTMADLHVTEYFQEQSSYVVQYLVVTSGVAKPGPTRA